MFLAPQVSPMGNEQQVHIPVLLPYHRAARGMSIKTHLDELDRVSYALGDGFRVLVVGSSVLQKTVVMSQ